MKGLRCLLPGGVEILNGVKVYYFRERKFLLAVVQMQIHVNFMPSSESLIHWQEILQKTLQPVINFH